MTNPIYETTVNDLGKTIIIRTDPDGRIWSFMEDPANADYQIYLAQLPPGKPAK